VRFPSELEQWRIRSGEYASRTGNDFGAFIVPGPCGRDLRIIASPGYADENIPWEHVSVSLPNRCPNWPEMCFVKGLFWDDEDTVMQLHPPKSQYVNTHNFCLHLWRPVKAQIPMPPLVAV
jgi:hypothetical protein